MELTRISVAQLAGGCRGETARHQPGERAVEGYCFELFRRAICQRDHAAWAAVVSQYRGMVLAWVRRRAQAFSLREEDDYWVNRTFERFWIAVGPERFGQFGSQAALMKYLQMCAYSVLADERRARPAVPDEPLPEEPKKGGDGRLAGAADLTGNAEVAAMGHVAAGELWVAITRECATEAERLTMYLSMALDLKAQEIRDRHPEHFPSTEDVYRIKRNVLERLRRSPEIRKFLE